MTVLLRTLICVLTLTVAGELALASTAVDKVREGVRSFADGDFEAAGKAFSEADVVRPENATIVFDRACALAATGDAEKARELFQQAALVRNIDLAARSHYNLGSLSAEQGRATLGDDPVAADPTQREQGLSQLLSAAGHYRDCLRLDADHSDARHNLELIRLFVKHIEAQWEQHDREKARQEMGLLELLSVIEERQRALRSTVRMLMDETDSPQRRQVALETAHQQEELREELAPLKEKIAEQFAAAQQAPPGGGFSNQHPSQDPSAGRQMEQAQKLLTQLADEVGSRMIDAASTVAAGDFPSAAEKQRGVLDPLNQIFMAVAPFTTVLRRATSQQEQLTATSKAVIGVDSPAGASAPHDDGEAGGEGQPENASADDVTAEVTAEVDAPELEWEQTTIAEWSRMLSLKARSELPRVEAQLQAAQQAEADPAQAPDPGQATKDDDPGHPHGASADSSAQLEGLQQSLQKAIELAPKVEQHSTDAATHLGKSDLAGALPDQQQAQQLLHEIAEPLQQENQQPPDEQNDKQQGQDQNQNPQQQDQQQDQKQDQKQDQEQQQPEQQTEQQSAQSPQQRAMSVVRRARQRERQHRDLQMQLQKMVGGRAPVDRDW